MNSSGIHAKTFSKEHKKQTTQSINLLMQFRCWWLLGDEMNKGLENHMHNIYGLNTWDDNQIL